MVTPPVREADTGLRATATTLVTDAGLPTDGLDQAWKVLVTVNDRGSVIGTVALERHGDGPSAVYLLRSLAVRADSQGAGLGAELVQAATTAADVDQRGTAAIGLLTETADGYFERFGFHEVSRDQLPAALSASAELTGACAVTAKAYLRAS